jgi:hypothetical protein
MGFLRLVSLIVIALFFTGCPKKLSITLHNDTSEIIRVSGYGSPVSIQAGYSSEIQVPIDQIIRVEGYRRNSEYRVVLPQPHSEFAVESGLTSSFTFQINPNGLIYAVPKHQRLPAPASTNQPKHFPLRPR